MTIASTGHSIDMAHYPVPGSLDEQGVGRPILELRDLWGRIIMHATKALIAGDSSSSPCPCGNAKKPCAGRIAIGLGKNAGVVAKCDRCGFFVTIAGWRGT